MYLTSMSLTVRLTSFMFLKFPASAASPRSSENITLSPGTPGAGEWNEAIQKGRLRHALLDSPPTGIEMSSFAAYSDLANNGWKSTLLLDQSWELESDVFDAIAKHFQIQQSKITKVDSLHAGTGAAYRGWHSASPYVIFSMDNHSPRARMSGKKIPDLEHWSDVTFLVHQQCLAEQNDVAGMTKLSLMVSGKINNRADNDIINIVIREMGIHSTEVSQTLAFPGESVQSESPSFFALLGTANGGGIARFLSDHKSSLGWKCIKDITIVFDPKPCLGIDLRTKKRPTAYWLLFQIDDHPNSPTKQSD